MGVFFTPIILTAAAWYAVVSELNYHGWSFGCTHFNEDTQLNWGIISCGDVLNCCLIVSQISICHLPAVRKWIIDAVVFFGQKKSSYYF